MKKGKIMISAGIIIATIAIVILCIYFWVDLL